MFGQSNIFISYIERRNMLLLFSILLMLLPAYSWGQDTLSVVKPLRESDIRSHIWNVRASYISGYQPNIELSTASDYSEKFGNFIAVGAEASIMFLKWFEVGLELGYKFESFSPERYSFKANSFNTHWITNDLHILMWEHLLVGLKADYLLNTSYSNNLNYSVAGLNADCFNRLAVATYLGASLDFSILRMSIACGVTPVSKLNADKVAYYNMTETKVGLFFWEVKLYFRIFTTGSRL